jgi:hypothetical protein
MSSNAFVDNGFSPGHDFCVNFLSSREFSDRALKSLTSSAPRTERKQDTALRIADFIKNGQLSYEKVLLAYVNQPRMWLSLKQGRHTKTPTLKSPNLLLQEFGDEGWYGPISDSIGNRKWYIRTLKISDYIQIGRGEASQLEQRRRRWSIIAEVGNNYVALSWNGFTYSHLTEEELDADVQFPFWKHIPNFFEELSGSLQGEWFDIELHRLVLHNMWDKYLNNCNYKWQHLRIRAEASGVVLNVHSSRKIEEINVRGLEVLARKLAQSSLETLGFLDDLEKLNHCETALLRILIKEWGTKSYEFSLDKKLRLAEEDSSGLSYKTKWENCFKAHCYFGLRPGQSQDSLKHLRCYMDYYGGSTKVLNFLLMELGL